VVSQVKSWLDGIVKKNIFRRGEAMPFRKLDPYNLQQYEDWEGNNAAFLCPLCENVFIVSETRMHTDEKGEKGYRRCPSCGKSIGRVKGGRKSGGTASIEW
jgi:hypothetical protein